MDPDPRKVRDRPSPWHVRTALTLSLALAACQVPTGGPISASASPGATPAAVDDCPAIELVSPQGNLVDLTGAWTTGSIDAGNEVVYELRQEGECVWGRAYSAFAGQEPAAVFDMVLVGTVGTDFIVELDLLELSVGHPPGYPPQNYPPFGRAAMTLSVAFEVTDGGELITMSITDLNARVLPDAPPDAKFLFAGNGPKVGQVLTRSP